MRLESALEIVGALKSRFGEPMTVTDICRLVPLSYQPVYEYVRRLAKAEAVSFRKEGQRLLCEPAATAAGSLWLAQWSLGELCATKHAAVRELAGVVQGRMGEVALPPDAIVALDPVSRGRVEAYVTDAGASGLPAAVRVHPVSTERLAECLIGPDGSWEVARRIIPIAGHQQLWWLALVARERAADRSRPPHPQPIRRRSIFID